MILSIGALFFPANCGLELVAGVRSFVRDLVGAFCLVEEQKVFVKDAVLGFKESSVINREIMEIRVLMKLSIHSLMLLPGPTSRGNAASLTSVV